jgi:hypothetical protein
MDVDVEYLNGGKLFAIPQFLTPQECDAFIERSERLGYIDAPINTALGPLLRKDVRDNHRLLLDDPGLAAAWWERASTTTRSTRGCRSCAAASMSCGPTSCIAPWRVETPAPAAGAGTRG